MPQKSKDKAPADNAMQNERRDQEVIRAKRELAAYFNGRRTEREARAALKTIKAFIRDRERMEPAALRPLPGMKASHAKARKQQEE